jgi:hypothetical protein
MNRCSILNEAYEWLRYKKLVSSKKEFAEHIGIDKTNLSSAFNGMEKYLTDNLFIKISEAFPQLNRNWLLTGKGNVQKAQSVSTDFENTNQQSEDMNANDFLKALAEEQSLTREALAQNARLIGIIERLHGIDGVGTRISPPLQNQGQIR